MIQRTPLRTDVHRELQDLILRGELPPGLRLRDTDLAERLGVSRTPVREALVRLEREGFLSAQMGQGFSVRPLSEREVSEVYPLVSALECMALQSLRGLSPDQVSRLEELAVAMDEGGQDPLKRITLDMDWHHTLLRECANAHLFRMLDDLRRIMYRYECAFMQVSTWVSSSVKEHRAIAEALARGHRRQAEQRLGAHWERSLRTLQANIIQAPDEP
jgi:DNA-binding GntR family transcriptional regulator